MPRKASAISALTILATQLGLPATAIGQEAIIIEKRCDEIIAIEDRIELQRILEVLIETNPDDPCIPLVVAQLGGPPFAQAPPVTEPPY